MIPNPHPTARAQEDAHLSKKKTLDPAWIRTLSKIWESAWRPTFIDPADPFCNPE